MFFYLVISLGLAQNSITIQFESLCKCSELVSQSDCERDFYCSWHKNKCEDIECDQLNLYLCQTSRQCYIKFQNQTGQCSKFSTNDNNHDMCGQLQYNNSHSCYDQNVWCTNQANSNTCVKQSTTHCESIPNENECFYNFGYCAWNFNNNLCQVAICDQLTNYQCAYYPYYCILNDNTCVEAQCQYLPQYFCNYVIKEATQNSYTIQVCQYNYTNNQCEEISANELDDENCYKNSLHSYYWNKKSCQKCDSKIVLIISLIIYIVF